MVGRRSRAFSVRSHNLAISEMGGCLSGPGDAVGSRVCRRWLLGLHIFAGGRRYATLRLDRLHEEGGKLPHRELLFDHFDVGRRDA